MNIPEDTEEDGYRTGGAVKEGRIKEKKGWGGGGREGEGRKNVKCNTSRRQTPLHVQVARLNLDSLGLASLNRPAKSHRLDERYGNKNVESQDDEDDG